MDENEKEEAEPWYSAGLKFRCTQCGNCCTGAPGAVWVDDEEIEAIAEFLSESVGAVRLFHTRMVRRRVSLKEFPNGDCVFFDANTRKCKVYDARPKQCRTWPFWRSNLESEASWQEIQPDCPGAGQGDLVPLEEIEIRLRTVDV